MHRTEVPRESTGRDAVKGTTSLFDARYHVPRSQVWRGSRGRQTGKVHLHDPESGRALCGRRGWYERPAEPAEPLCPRCEGHAAARRNGSVGGVETGASLCGACQKPIRYSVDDVVHLHVHSGSYFCDDGHRVIYVPTAGQVARMARGE